MILKPINGCFLLTIPLQHALNKLCVSAVRYNNNNNNSQLSLLLEG